MANQDVYKPAKGRATIVTILLAVFIATRLLGVWSSAAYGSAAAYAEDDLELTGPQTLKVIADLGVFFLLAAYIASLSWMYRISANAHSFKKSMQHSKAAALFWYVVPFASLVMPFFVFREIWEVSTNKRRKNGLIGLWWAAFLAHLVALNVVSVPGLPASGAIACDVIIIGAAGFFIYLMREVMREQAQTSATEVFGDAPGMIMMGDEPAATPAQ